MSRPERGAIGRLAERAEAARLEDFSQKSVEHAKLVLLDTLGCGLAALDDACARAVLETVVAFGGVPRCTLIGLAQQRAHRARCLATHHSFACST